MQLHIPYLRCYEVLCNFDTTTNITYLQELLTVSQ